MEVGNLIADLGDTHIYKNHIDAVKEQLERDPNKYKLPRLYLEDDGEHILNSKINLLNIENIIDIFNDLTWDMFGLKNYQHYSKLENPIPLNTGLV